MWKKITEELPQENQIVLIAILHKYSNCPWEYSITEAVYRNNDWCAEMGHSYSAPTHWMPLPEAPPIQITNR